MQAVDKSGFAPTGDWMCDEGGTSDMICHVKGADEYGAYNAFMEHYPLLLKELVQGCTYIVFGLLLERRETSTDLFKNMLDLNTLVKGLSCVCVVIFLVLFIQLLLGLCNSKSSDISREVVKAYADKFMPGAKGAFAKLLICVVRTGIPCLVSAYNLDPEHKIPAWLKMASVVGITLTEVQNMKATAEAQYQRHQAAKLRKMRS